MSLIHDDTRCALGEGPLWHPDRNQLFWFDIEGHRLHSKGQHWQFDEHVSAAGWVSRDELLIASSTALFTFHLDTGKRETVAALESNNRVTRSNDGRADPWGGFWIGTMGKAAEPEAGAIYRLHDGRLERLYRNITIPNAICFAPDRGHAYFADTPTQVIRRVALDGDGWPKGKPQDWLDLGPDDWRPDGAVTDADGNLWNAQWGGARVACYAPDGSFRRAVELPAKQTTCPAFGGPDLTTLFCTSAAEGMQPSDDESHPANGQTLAAEDIATGLAEPRVIL